MTKNDRFAPDAVLEDGTCLYFKTTNFGRYGSLQLELYDMLKSYKAAIGKDIEYDEESSNETG